MRDLLISGTAQRLEIQNTRSSGTNVAGVQQVEVNTTQDVLDVMARGETNRATADTKMNERSSRSHSVLTVIVDGYNTITGARPPLRQSSSPAHADALVTPLRPPISRRSRAASGPLVFNRLTLQRQAARLRHLSMISAAQQSRHGHRGCRVPHAQGVVTRSGSLCCSRSGAVHRRCACRATARSACGDHALWWCRGDKPRVPAPGGPCGLGAGRPQRGRGGPPRGGEAHQQEPQRDRRRHERPRLEGQARALQVRRPPPCGHRHVPPWRTLPVTQRPREAELGVARVVWVRPVAVGQAVCSRRCCDHDEGGVGTKRGEWTLSAALAG